MFPLMAVIAAFAVGAIVILAIGDNPIEVYRILLSSAFGFYDALGNFTFDNWGYTLFYATPLIFTGLAVAVAFRCGLLNIGAEGQLYIAAFATAWVGIKFGGTVVNIFGKQEDWSWTTLPPVVLIPLCMGTAVVAGALWGAIPGILKAKFGSHEVINTIMLNFIAVALVSYFTQYYYKIPGDPIDSQ